MMRRVCEGYGVLHGSRRIRQRDTRDCGRRCSIARCRSLKSLVVAENNIPMLHRRGSATSCRRTAGKGENSLRRPGSFRRERLRGDKPRIASLCGASGPAARIHGLFSVTPSGRGRGTSNSASHCRPPRYVVGSCWEKRQVGARGGVGGGSGRRLFR